MKVVHGTEVRISGVVAPDSGRIGDHRFEFLPHNRFGVGQVDRVPVALAHLPAIRAEHFWILRELLHRLKEHRLVQAIEPAGQLSGEFQVRQLIFPYRHEIRFVDKDIRCLENWIAEKSIRA